MNGYARLARTLMNQHGLSDWNIKWSRAKKTHGLCQYSTKTLTFSAVAFAHIGEEEVRNTILHEIAHALAGASAGHGYKWKQIHREIGGTGAQYVTRTASATIPTAWTSECSKGHKGSGQHRAPLRVKACAKCSSVWRPENILTWKKNGVKVCLRDMPDRYKQEAVSLNARYGVKF